ncbi:MAG: hypothetical protein JXA71_15555 [Chitinispirillaceae bacterium]|nr:hypothetical protein [Chitinispirillaceae bacterium]
MRNVLLFKQIALAIMLFSASAAAPGSLSTYPSTTLQLLESIKAKIDSLEVEKQTEKRNGRSIVDLEQMTAILQDSVALLRQELLRQKQNPAPSLPGKLDAYIKYLPSSLGIVDTIIIGIGAAAVLFAVIFLFFLTSAASRRRKKAAAIRPSVPRPVTEPAATPFLMDSSVQRAYAAQTAKVPEPPLQRDKPLDRPRSPGPVYAPPAAPTTGQGPLNDLVVQAVNDGLDIKAISRRFKIGVDQVALILKMAKRKG